MQTPPSIYFENQFYTYAFDPTFNRNMWKLQKKTSSSAEEITSEKFESVKNTSNNILNQCDFVISSSIV